MSRQSHTRLVILHVLVLSLFATLGGRLWFLQVMSGDKYVELAAANRVREIVTPAMRGQILTSTGRPLVRNRTELVISVERATLNELPNGGEKVLRRLGHVLDMSYTEVTKQVRLCQPGVSRPCWPGSPYQPIPVTDDADPKVALQILERKEDFPGVVAQTQPVRAYPEPLGASAAHTVGYLQPASDKELKEREGLQVQFGGVTLVGRDGMEATYDKYLRGETGVKYVGVDSRGEITETLRRDPPKPGSHVVTSINARVQDALEKALRDTLENNASSEANSAAGVVLDVRTGRVVATASLPTYDPSVWVGGISQEKYERLTSKKANNPLLSRAVQGQYPVGSTFKPISLAAAVKAGFPLKDTYPCPSGYEVGGRVFHNYGNKSYGMIDLHRALVVSCDTIFYRLSHTMWKRQGGTKPKNDPTEPIPHMAKAFGFDKETGIDLPHESSGRIPDPQWKREFWKATRDYNCKHAKTGYPEVAKEDPSRAKYLKKLAKGLCKRGYVWRAGDAVNLSIGQGDMLATPLQLARAYAAIANGGTLFSPRIGKAIVRPDGTLVKKITPPKAGKLPVDDRALRYIRDALADVPRKGTAAGTFAGFPLDKVPIAGKTGTAEKHGREDTSWFASFAPADNPRFATVVVVPQGGLGSQVAAPAVRDVWEAIYGVSDGKVHKKKAIFPNGSPPEKLPAITPDGIIHAPPGYQKAAAGSWNPPTLPAKKPAE